MPTGTADVVSSSDEQSKRSDPTGPRVLLVDDDPDVREMVGEMLVECGFDVTLASDGSQALERLDENIDVDVLLSDFSMPGMNGATLIDAARARRPLLRTLIMTGYADLASHAGVESETLLLKPFSMRALQERITELLGSGKE